MDPSPSEQNAEPDERILALVDEYLDRRQSGEEITPERFLVEHAEVGPALEPYLAALPLIDRAFSSASTTRAQSAGEAAGEHAGLPPVTGYQLMEEIGRGGMGVVYKALQLSTKRVVALKVMLAGPFASPEARRRFDREVELAARLQHPGVVRILESGEVAGQRYYAMDYVSGARLDRYLSVSQPDLRTTLSLFVKICAAVSAAHLQGVIHRDLKPGNVLIDAAGEPHILDFGLAKVATGQVPNETQPPGMTQTGQFMGSLAWASPEQAEAIPDKIDMRTDVYALGVILYQMLTGEFPYEVVGNMHDVLENILRAEPTRPSTLRKQIDDEVETIVLKCLSKERERRYQSTGELAREVSRYLNGEPIEAKRDSALYVLRKQLRRYRIPVVVAAAFVVVVTAGFITSVTFWQQAAGERDAAVAARAEAEQRGREAAEARDQLRVVVGFQSSMLSGIDAEQMGGGIVADLRERIRESLNAEAITPDEVAAALASFDALVRRVNPTNVAREVVDHHVLSPAFETIERDFADQPLVEAVLRQTVGDTYRELGLGPQAMPQMERALALRRRVLGDDHPDTLVSINNTGLLLWSMGKYAEAEPYCREALAGRRRVLGDDHLDTLVSINNMGLLLQGQGKLAEAEPYCREALAGRRRVLGDDHPHTLQSLNNMGYLLQAQRKLAEAEPYYREALEGYRRVLGDDHPETLVSLNNTGLLLQAQGKYAEAEPYYREALEGRRRVLGDDHPHTLQSLNNMGYLLQAQGKLAEAEPYYREALAGRRRVLGDDHSDTLTSVNSMGRLLDAMGDYAEAEPYYREALEGNRRVLGNEALETLTSIDNLGLLLHTQCKYAAAEPYYREALAGRRRVLGDNHLDTLLSLNNLGHLLDSMGKYAAAEPYCRQALDGRRRLLGDDHRATLTSISNMGALLHHQGKLAEAEPYYREALDGRHRVLGDDHLGTLNSLNNMGLVLKALGKSAEAELYYREALEGYRRVLGDDHRATLTSINNMGVLLKSMGRLAEAEPYYHEALEGRRRLLGDDHSATLTSVNNMAGLLRVRGKLAEAEPYYREALGGRRRVLGDDHPHTLKSIYGMGCLRLDQGKLAEAEPLLTAAVDGARRSLSENHWSTGVYLGGHGKCLTELKRYTDAEAALLDAYGILDAALGAEHVRTIRVIKSLAALYDAWGKPEQAANYGALLPSRAEPE